MTRWQRFTLGMRFAFGRMTKDDAQEMHSDVCYISGWMPLMTLCEEDVLERFEADDAGEYTPWLRAAVADAVVDVSRHWETYDLDIAIHMAVDYVKALQFGDVEVVECEP